MRGLRLSAESADNPFIVVKNHIENKSKSRLPRGKDHIQVDWIVGKAALPGLFIVDKFRIMVIANRFH